jgi:DNA adenine methylase
MLADTGYRNYFEPFLGGGAVYFGGGFERARLSDVNGDLVVTYNAVQGDVDRVLRHLGALPAPSRTAFVAVAASQPRSEAGRAARFLYLNRLAFNGVWRVNATGAFNVPYGGRPPADLIRAAQLRACAQLLQRCSIQCVDFREALAGAGKSDLVYCDPPYTVSHNNNGFIRYNEKLFRWVDQQALASRARELLRLGAHVVISNAAHHDVVALYPRAEFHAFRIVKTSRVASGVQFRQPQAEMLFVGRNVFDDRRAVIRAMRLALAATSSVVLT